MKKYKMLVVDDNPYDREDVKNAVKSSNDMIEIVGECSNVKKALALVEELSPDIIITDIAMPITNGIKMAQILKESHPTIKLIFMSSHYEFDYAKSAIDLAAYGYILKPIERDELIKVIRNVLNIYETENHIIEEKKIMEKQLEKMLPLLQEQFIRELLFGICRGQKDIFQNMQYLRIDAFSDYLLQVITFEVANDLAKMNEHKIDERYYISYSIKKQMQEYNNDIRKIQTIQISDKEFSCLLIYKKPNEGKEIEYNITYELFRIKEELCSKTNSNIKVGVSKVSNSFEDAHELYCQSLDAIKTKIYSGENQFILFEEIETDRDVLFEEKVNLEQLLGEIKIIINSGTDDDVYTFLNKYLSSEEVVKSESYVKSLSFSVVNSIQIVLMDTNDSLDNIFDKKLAVWQKLNNFNTIVDIRKWLFNIILASKQYLTNKPNSSYALIANKIKDVIHQKYNEHLTLNQIADLINFSPSHANNIFKSVTNQTIFDYVMEYRIKKAKEILKDPYSKIYIVSEQVGYSNKSHFCLQFKKFTGFTPAEYKNIYAG